LALIWRQGIKIIRAGKRELSLKSLLAGFAAIKDPEIVNYNLGALLDIPQSIDNMPFNILILASLGVIIAGIINTICIKENAAFPYIVPKGESVRSDNSKVLRGSIVRVNIMQREEGSLLVRNKRIDLPAYKC
jgi:hypothetical protein